MRAGVLGGGYPYLLTSLVLAELRHKVDVIVGCFGLAQLDLSL
jgi:hypothetical protein